MIFDMDKFSIAQMTSNDDGKTSGSGTMGILSIVVGLVGFISGTIYYFIKPDSTLIMQSLVLIGMGKALLWYRKSKENEIK